ncbi:hypothetical protein L596_006590 [Steinernema carpocapsae]|uniref:peroxidase n=2 Tax=Steinernema carpocapsae TaxID=34508 RepID=A0A4U8VBI8_STECR|nr:hypothetical protein L596_006590 [Steinernema carpocapsae]
MCFHPVIERKSEQKNGAEPTDASLFHNEFATMRKWAVLLPLLLLLPNPVSSQGDDNPITERFKCRKNGCCDQHEWCRFWASVGECRTNFDWMAENCELACNTCRRGPVSTRGRSPFTPQRPRVTPASRPAPSTAPFPALPNQPRPAFATRRPPPTRPRQPTPSRLPVTPRPTFPPQNSRPPSGMPKLTTAQAVPVPVSNVANALQRCRQIQANPSNAAESLIREGLIFATEDNSGRRTLSQEQVVRSNIANACVPRNDEAECLRSLCYNLHYRTMDGTCNNFQIPLRGAAFRPYNRLMQPEYDNRLSEPVSSILNLRPSAREASRTILSSRKTVHINEFNALLMQFGQLMSHDMAKTTLVPSAKCNACQNIPGRCMAVFISANDPNNNFKSNTCIRVSRSSAICGSGTTKPRQQLNENTAYIDGSPIYGSSVGDLHKFREGRTAFLKLPTFNGMRVLPFDTSKCRSAGSCTATFVAGDSRVNLFLGLTSYHVLFTREHNRIAATLQRLNPSWNADRLFQEARKIVGAQIQAIAFREYLPKVLGSTFATLVGEYRGYNPNVDSTLANEFTAGAYRFGHGMIQEIYPRLDEGFRNMSVGAIPFSEATLHSDRLLFQGGIDPIVRGMMVTPLKRPQRLTTSITEQMFGSTDLGTINIQRGRDHGLPPYVKFRELCGMGRASNFDQLGREILSAEARANLQRVYRTVDRVDFYVGAVLEDPVVRGLIGPTLACVVGPQFKRTRDGDRFYYENPGIFTRAQLAEIRRSSLSRIICDNGDNIHQVPREAFRLGQLVPCNQIPQMDLTKWKE